MLPNLGAAERDRHRPAQGHRGGEASRGQLLPQTTRLSSSDDDVFHFCEPFLADFLLVYRARITLDHRAFATVTAVHLFLFLLHVPQVRELGVWVGGQAVTSPPAAGDASAAGATGAAVAGAAGAAAGATGPAVADAGTAKAADDFDEFTAPALKVGPSDLKSS